MTLTSDNLQALLTQIYEAATDTAQWESTLTRLLETLETESCHLFVIEKATMTDHPLGMIVRQDPDIHREYFENFFQHDIRIPRLLTATPGEFYHDQQLWSEQERNSNPVYTDFFRSRGYYGSSVGISSTAEFTGGLSFTLKERESFGHEKAEFIKTLMPHVRRALRISFTLSAAESQTSGLGQAWSMSGRGVVILSPAGRVTYHNEEADAMQRAGIVRIRDNRLSFRESDLNTQLTAALHALRHGLSDTPQNRQSASISHANGENTGVRFMPILGSSESQASALVVLLVPLSCEPSASAIEVKQFAALFRLTPAEQALLHSIAANVDLNAHALERKISVGTARKYLKSVLSKTRCHSQKELVRLIERFCFLNLR